MEGACRSCPKKVLIQIPAFKANARPSRFIVSHLPLTPFVCGWSLFIIRSEVSSTATTCPEMFWDCPVFLTQLSQPRDIRDSPGLSQVSVMENTHIPQYLVSQDTHSQDTQDSPRKSRQAWSLMDPEILSVVLQVIKSRHVVVWKAIMTHI